MLIAAMMGITAAGPSSASIPQGDWSVQRTGSVCLASRNFLIDGAAVGVGFEPWPLGTHTSVIIVEQSASQGVEIGSAAVSRDSGGEPHVVYYSSWPAKGNHRVVRFSISNGDLGSLDAGGVITMDRDAKAFAIPLDGFPLEAVEQCDAKSLAQLGVDMASERRIPTPPQRPSRSAATPNDYPTAAIRLGEQGVVDMVLGVDQKGKVTNCQVANSSGYDDLDAASCNTARRPRYEPARDAGGNSVAAHIFTQAVWTLPDRGEPSPHGKP